MRKILTSGPLLLLSGILCVVFAILTFTTKAQTEHRLYNFDEQVLLNTAGATRVDIVCNGSKFDYASTWNESSQLGDELNFSDLVQKNYPESLLNRLDDACSSDFKSRSSDKMAFGAVAALMAGYFVWGFRKLMKAE